MQTIFTIHEYAAWYYKKDSTTYSEENTIRQMCVDGAIKNAKKIGRQWRINMSAEYPEWFPDTTIATVEVAIWDDRLAQLQRTIEMLASHLGLEVSNDKRNPAA